MYKIKSGRNITYYGIEYTKDLKRKDKNNNGKINTINELFGLLLDVWCRETAYPSCQHDYIHDNDPTYGQCAITAFLVNDMFGGTIHKIRVDGGETHYFNKINGHYIDLTSDQFELYDIPVCYEPNEKISREYCGQNSDTQKRFNILIELLNKKIKEE